MIFLKILVLVSFFINPVTFAFNNELDDEAYYKQWLQYKKHIDNNPKLILSDDIISLLEKINFEKALN